MSSGPPVFVTLIGMIGAAVLLAGLVSGIVLIVVGAAKKRRGVLIGGVVVLALTGTVMLTMGVLAGLMYFAVSESPAPMRAPIAVPMSEAELTAAAAGLEHVPEAVALDDPFGLRAVAANPPQLQYISHGGDDRLFHAAVRVDEAFETALQWHFEKATWAEAQQAAAGHGSFDPVKLWAGADLKGLPCYRRSFKADGESHVAYVCYDAKTRRAYLFRMRAP